MFNFIQNALKNTVEVAVNGEDMSAQLKGFAASIGLDAVAPNRYSMLLVLGLFGGLMSQRLNPAKVIYEIRALEGLAERSQLKPPIQNKHPPLKGLWHKHYMESGLPAMAINLRRALQRHGLSLFEQRAREAQEANEERYMVPEDVKAIMDDAVQGNLNRLRDSAALTGEWILYARHEGANYYLCLAGHDKSQHENIRRQIDSLCCQEFPFLAELLANA